MKNFSSKLTAYIPVVLPHITERNALINKFENGLNEFISLSNKLKIKFINDYEVFLNTTLVKDVTDLSIFKKIWEGRPSPFWDFWFLIISTKCKFSKGDVENYIGDFWGSSFPRKKDLYMSVAAREIEKLSNDLLLALNLSKCGLITTSKGTVFYDNRIIGSNIRGTHNIFFEAQRNSFENGWPQILELKLEKVWNWLNSFSFFNRSMGEGPIGRAIAAITHLLKDDYSEAIDTINLDTIWILIGLEALYGRNKSGLKNQIIEKSRAFLGEPNKNKKRLSKSYDLRSRVIHGDIDIPFNYCIYDGHEKYENLSDSLNDTRLVVLSLLIATLQKLIAEGRTELEFEFQVLGWPNN